VLLAGYTFGVGRRKFSFCLVAIVCRYGSLKLTLTSAVSLRLNSRNFAAYITARRVGGVICRFGIRLH